LLHGFHDDPEEEEEEDFEFDQEEDRFESLDFYQIERDESRDY
jgi:hypothetical protein